MPLGRSLVGDMSVLAGGSRSARCAVVARTHSQMQGGCLPSALRCQIRRGHLDK